MTTMPLTIDLTLEQSGQLGLTESLEQNRGQDHRNQFGHGGLKNILSSMRAYADMSPDLDIRKDVNSWMLRRDRQALTFSDWCQLFRGHQCQDEQRQNEQRQNEPCDRVLRFIYESFGQYSGLNFSRVRPNDSLNNHLHFPLVCWFDWSITFCEDFCQSFGLDLSDRFDEADFNTIGDMANFLIEQVSVLETVL